MARIDGKYEELREISRFGAETLLEVRDPQGDMLHLGWFDVSTPAARSGFHRYRAALKALQPAGLLDVVARPGAYYSLWRPLNGTPLMEYLEGSDRDGDTVDAVRDLAARLAEQGYALSDADVRLVDGKPEIARLAPTERTPEEIESLNAPVLSRLAGGRLRRQRNTPRPRSRQRVTWLGVVPGLLFLAAALYLAPQAAQIYLNPNVATVPDVIGVDAQSAAETLVKSGYRVTFADGESDGARLGSVIGQSPEQGASLHSGRLVTLTVNNPPPLTVPKVEELTLAQARAALAEVRLKVGEVHVVDGGVTGTPEGRIVAQTPAAGSTVARGQEVQLLVSGGVRARQTWLPDLSGLPFDDARDLVRKAGLVVARVETRTSDAPENSVLAQQPAPYRKVDVGSPVTLTVARAPLASPVDAVESLPLAREPEPVVPPPVTPQPRDEAPRAEVPAPAPEEPTSAPEPEAPGEPTRTVQIDYTFPREMPLGNVEIVVRDADGERTVLSSMPTASAAGNRAEGPVEVRGEARFSVRVNGEEVASFTR